MTRSFAVSRRAWLLLVALPACITVRVVQVDKKSTLEQQFIGEYEELTDDLMTVSSVRALATGLGFEGDDPYARALQARRLQAFYKEDLERARARGCLGEALDGRVKVLPCGKKDKDAEPASRPSDEMKALQPKTERVALIENAAREALVAYALAKNPNLKESDRQAVWQAYRRIVLAGLKTGNMVQNLSGEWVGHDK